MSKLNEDIIIRYLENRCSEEDFVLINEWMKESDENAGELFRMEEIYQLGKFPFEEENLVVRAERRLGRRLEQENQKKQEVFKLRSVLRYAAAIVGVIVLAAGLAYWFRNKAEELVVASAAHGQVREMLLPDGTKVWLNQSSVLKYPRAFEGKERHVYLDGEAYFEVSKNPKKPFRVKANGVTIRVLGTHFNVNAYAADSLVETTLLEGSVSVSNNANGKQMILKPNETAIYRKSTGILSMHINANAQNEISWREGVLSFNDISMGEIARQLSHHFNVTIQIKSEQLRNYKLNARFKQNETLEEILEMLAPIVGFTYHMPQSNLIELKQEN